MCYVMDISVFMDVCVVAFLLCRVVFYEVSYCFLLLRPALSWCFLYFAHVSEQPTNQPNHELTGHDHRPTDRSTEMEMEME